MAENENVNAPVAAGSLESEITNVEKILNEDIKPREESMRKGKTIRIVILVIVVLYFGFLYHLVASFTANEAMLMVRGQLDSQLPTMKAETVQQMKEAAPKVVDDYAQQMVKNVPSWRAKIEQELLNYTQQNISELENGMNQMCEGLIASAKAEMDSKDPNLTSEQKAERITQEISVKLHEERTELVNGIAKEYTSTMKELITNLKKLQSSTNLTAKEKHQKEMLRLWVKLMNMKLKDVNKMVQEGSEAFAKEQADIAAKDAEAKAAAEQAPAPEQPAAQPAPEQPAPEQAPAK